MNNNSVQNIFYKKINWVIKWTKPGNKTLTIILAVIFTITQTFEMSTLQPFIYKRQVLLELASLFNNERF